MILTGPEIKTQIFSDGIHVDPYDPNLVGPNSIDLRLGNKLLVYETATMNTGFARVPVDARHMMRSELLDMKRENPTVELEIPEEGYVLNPGVLYLGRTIETIGSEKFVPIVEGRSSVGRLGIHVHVTAGFCDIGFKGTITLEIHVVHPIVVYPNLPICQAYFLTPQGAIELYKGRYQGQVEPTASRFSRSKPDG